MLFADCPSFDKRRQKIKAFYRTQDCVSNLLKRFTYAIQEFSNKLPSKYDLPSPATRSAHPNHKRHPPQSNAVSKIANLTQENAEVRRHNVLGAPTYRSDIA